MRRLFHERMRGSRAPLRGAGALASCLVLLLGAGLLVGAGGQMIPPQQPLPPPSQPGAWGDGSNSRDPMVRRQEEKMEQARNVYRQQQLVKDTDRLLALATELKTEVDKTNKDILSVDVIKKADQIEKLAKSVKEKMKQ
jgi:hypothetical protein